MMQYQVDLDPEFTGPGPHLAMRVVERSRKIVDVLDEEEVSERRGIVQVTGY